MRISPMITVFAALITLILVGIVGARIVQPDRPLLTDVSFSLNAISPNADGVEDVTEIKYVLNRPAQVSITFTNQDSGVVFHFREQAARPPNTYQVLFSGVVEGYTLPGETIEGVVERRLMPNGRYTWLLSVQGENGESATQSGELTISGTDPRLPIMNSFEVAPQIFTPNQDGYDDRIAVNLYLAKEAELTVWLENDQNGPYYIAERTDGARRPGEEGARTFDYDGGVDNNMTPPPDGEYRLIAVAQDKEGQRVRREVHLTIKDSGKPNAEIVAQSTGRTVTWESHPYEDVYFTNAETPGKAVEPPTGVQSTLAVITLPQSDLLIFSLTISNYGTVPIRTIGPFPGTVYQYDQTDAAMKSASDREAISGAWRVGVQCERSESSYPWRWALGTPETLTTVERDGETLWYLMPGQKTLVWGAVRMTRLIPTRNPQKCFVALIHEDVAIPPLQNRVGEIDVKLEPKP